MKLKRLLVGFKMRWMVHQNFCCMCKSRIFGQTSIRDTGVARSGVDVECRYTMGQRSAGTDRRGEITLEGQLLKNARHVTQGVV
jgi:hypothetical protein